MKMRYIFLLLITLGCQERSDNTPPIEIDIYIEYTSGDSDTIRVMSHVPTHKAHVRLFTKWGKSSVGYLPEGGGFIQYIASDVRTFRIIK